MLDVCVVANCIPKSAKTSLSHHHSTDVHLCQLQQYQRQLKRADRNLTCTEQANTGSIALAPPTACLRIANSANGLTPGASDLAFQPRNDIQHCFRNGSHPFNQITSTVLHGVLGAGVFELQRHKEDSAAPKLLLKGKGGQHLVVLDYGFGRPSRRGSHVQEGR